MKKIFEDSRVQEFFEMKAEFVDFHSSSNSCVLETDDFTIYFPIRNLYEFFDAHGIHIFVKPQSEYYFGYVQTLPDYEDIPLTDAKKTRMACELLCFDRAYGLLS